VNIPANIYIILVKFVILYVHALRGAVFTIRQKNVYFVLIAENQLLLLVDDVKFIKEDIMLHPIIKDFMKKL
jgi:hypothetical protein